jgi:hypothetical protein
MNLNIDNYKEKLLMHFNLITIMKAPLDFLKGSQLNKRRKYIRYY